MGEEESKKELEKIIKNPDDYFIFPEEIGDLKDYKGEDFKDPNSFIEMDHLLDYALDLYKYQLFPESLVYFVFYREKMGNMMAKDVHIRTWNIMSWISISINMKFVTDLGKKNIEVKEDEELDYYETVCSGFLKYRSLIGKFKLDLEYPFKKEKNYLIRCLSS
jgi:hypothetical protein